MAANRRKKLRPSVLQDDLKAFAALQAIGGYTPSNDAYKITNIAADKTQMETDQTAEIQKRAAADAAGDKTCESQWKFHDLMLGAKDQIKAQFGADSDEYASLGLKKKSDYRTGRRTAAKTALNPA